ncbi:hypothetical protein, partial [Alicyclobacillus sp.]|uniref:hypothetical protein n=1 Tax=Alicyclobacillus sp. TaxID=61169 RepID=UPI0025BEFB9D
MLLIFPLVGIPLIPLVVPQGVFSSLTLYAQTTPPGNSKASDKSNSDGKTPPPASDVELVERLHAARKEYENSLKALYEHYARVGDRQRWKWVEEELLGYHLLFKPSYNLDVKDVPPATLKAEVNIPAANELY